MGKCFTDLSEYNSQRCDSSNTFCVGDKYSYSKEGANKSSMELIDINKKALLNHMTYGEYSSKKYLEILHNEMEQNRMSRLKLNKSSIS